MSYLNGTAESNHATSDGLDDLLLYKPNSTHLDHIVISLGMTALSLCFLGCFGTYQRRGWDADQAAFGPSSHSQKTSAVGFNKTTAHSIITRTLKVALPLFSSLELGGAAVAFALLATGSAGSLDHGGHIHKLTSIEGWKRFTRSRPWILAFFVFLLMTTIVASSLTTRSFLGCATLALSFFVYPPTLPEHSFTNSTPGSSPSSGSTVSAGTSKSWNPEPPSFLVAAQTTRLPLIDSPQETTFTLMTASLLALTTLMLYKACGLDIAVPQLLIALAIAALGCLSSIVVDVSSLGLAYARGVGVGCLITVASTSVAANSYALVLVDAAMAVACYAAVFMSKRTLHDADPSHTHHHHHHHHHQDTYHASRLSHVLLRRTKSYSLIHGILVEKDSRRIFYFMLLNLGFMVVQSTYGYLTGSLGLISDSIHMFFDCLALLMGLCASVMSKWPPNLKFPYGYGKIDTLAGFANGVFLMLISVEIVYEAVERLFEGSGLTRTTELLVVSTMGLCVNIVGLFAFEHGHAHHGHGHGHGHHSHDLSTTHTLTSTSKAMETFPSAHTHGHGGENMMGIYLHIMADALGSVAVVISTLLVQYTGWTGFDPLASCIIAILIFASAIPLVASSAKILLLSLHTDIEYNLRDILAGVSTLRDVVGYTVPKFWLDDVGGKKDASHDHQGHSHRHHGHTHGHSDDEGDESHHSEHGCSHSHPAMLGVIHIIASKEADMKDVRQRTVEYFRSKNMDIVVQIEREEEGRCWCGGGLKST